MQREGFHPTPPEDGVSNLWEFREFGKAHAICRQACANENAVRSNCEARQGRQHVVPVPRFASVWWHQSPIYLTADYFSNSLMLELLAGNVDPTAASWPLA